MRSRDASLSLYVTRRYTHSMWLALLGMHILELFFFTGIIGSSIVVIITSFEDAFELLGSSEEHPPEAKTPSRI